MLPDRILVVDDDPSWQELLAESIQGSQAAPPGGIALHIAGSHEEADALLDRQHFHLAFVDLRLKEDQRELEGKRLVQKIVGLDEGTSVVIATGHADVSTAITALREWNVLDFVLKDEWDPGKVAHLVETGLTQARLAYRSKYESSLDLLRGAQGVYGWTAAMLDLFAPANEVDRPDRRLADFLNRLLYGLQPLLPLKDESGMQRSWQPPAWRPSGSGARRWAAPWPSTWGARADSIARRPAESDSTSCCAPMKSPRWALLAP